MSKLSKRVKNKLFSIISDMEKDKYQYVKNPNSDFVRTRKLSFSTIMKILISMGGNTLHKELYSFFEFSNDTPTSSAFVQQRSKLLPYAFEFLLHKLNKAFVPSRRFKGYRLLAVDGSDIHIPTNPADEASYVCSNENSKGYNLLHLNVLYDLLEKRYETVNIQKCRHKSEHSALTQMIDTSDISDSVILLGDRGYEGYNCMAHAEKKGWKYLFRIKDTRGIIRAVSVPVCDEFDIDVNLLFTRRQTKETKGNPCKYRFLPSNVNFDYLPVGSKEYFPMSFRIVRVKIDYGIYETFVTNLDRDSFDIKTLKKLYRMRWGVETSFRELKYSIGLTNFHSKKPEFILQEIFARLIMYNISMIISVNVCVKQKTRAYAYQINFSEAIHICMTFLRCRRKNPPDVETLIQKNILPVRPDRKDTRKITYKSAVSFIYRVA